MKKKIWTAIVISLLFPYITTLAIGKAAITGNEMGRESVSGRRIFLDRENGGYMDLEDYPEWLPDRYRLTLRRKL